jgi:multiple sugar transport system permease protein
VSTEDRLSLGERVRELFRREEAFGYLLVAPLLLWLGITLVYPFLSAVALSFTNAGIIGAPAEFIGLANYREVIVDPDFWDSLRRSVVWAIGNAVVQTVLGLATALILNQRFRGSAVMRTWVILPWIIPTVVLVVIWRWLLSGGFGIGNYVLLKLGLISKMVSFFGDPKVAIYAVITINSWRWFPFIAIIILAGLQRIPQSEYEAARVDGASAIQQFKNITFPYLAPILILMGLLGILWSVNVFDLIWLSTQGGPGTATETLAVLIYDIGFKRLAMGESSAIAVLFFLIMLVFSIVYVLAIFPKGMIGILRRE